MSGRVRIRSTWRRLRCMLFGAGWLLVSSTAAAQPEAGAVSETPDSGILKMRDYLMSRLQTMPNLDVRAMHALDIDGRCAPATPCRAGTASVIATAPPLQVSTMLCELEVGFDGRALATITIEGRGRGPSCEVAQRDAPLQIAARLLSILKPEVRDWSDQEQLQKLARMLETLDRGMARLQENVPAAASDAALQAMDEALGELTR